MRLPPRRHLALDALGIPTGDVRPEKAEAAPIGTRTFDDGYELGRERRLAITGESGTALELRCGTGYPFAQVWVPSGRPFVALEPMTAPTNALVDRTAPVVRRGDTFTASYSLTLTHPD